MSVAEDNLKAKALELQTVIDEEQQEFANFVAGQEALIAALRAEIADGISPAVLGEVLAQMDASIADLRSTITLPPAEPPVA